MTVAGPPAAIGQVQVKGWCAPAFEPVAAIFGRVLADVPGSGAAVCIYHDGAPVVDLHGGPSFRPESRQLVFSVAKAVSAIAAHQAAADGHLDLDRPLGSFWSPFRRCSTSTITTRTVLAHRAGLPTVDRPLTVPEILDGGLERALERQEPYWEPGTDHGYHTVTFGTLLDGIFRRTLGVTVAQYVTDTIVEPLGLRLSFGIPEVGTDDVIPVVSQGTVTVELPTAAPDSPGLLDAAGFGLLDNPTIFNTPPLCTATFPALSVVARARDLARLLAATCGDVDGIRLLDRAILDAMRATHSRGRDRVSGEISHFGAGVALPSPRLPFLGAGSFGHDGHGGSLVAAHPDSGTTFAFSTDTVPRIGGASTGAITLSATLRQCLEQI
jgi:CubicO group peptidase (beta-lactamase class C family)